MISSTPIDFPFWTNTFLIFPSRSLLMMFCIFIASNTSNSYPSTTLSPGFTLTDITAPGIGDITFDL